jgi:hypothetical protein
MGPDEIHPYSPYLPLLTLIYVDGVVYDIL